MQEKKPVVAILMGSNSDWDVMKNAAEMLLMSRLKPKSSPHTECRTKCSNTQKLPATAVSV
jgi:phosphoribosylcarboxyaminoimidazole (NCAIR) mutase